MHTGDAVERPRLRREPPRTADRDVEDRSRCLERECHAALPQDRPGHPPHPRSGLDGVSGQPSGRRENGGREGRQTVARRVGHTGRPPGALRQVPRDTCLVGVRIGVQGAMQETKSRHTVHQRMVQFRIHREPSAFDTFDEVHLPQRTVTVEERAVQPGDQREQVGRPPGRRERRVPYVVFEVHLVVDGPPEVAQAGHRVPGPLAEHLVDHLGLEELRVQVGHVIRPRALRWGEHFERSHVHRMLSGFGEQEDRICHGHDPHRLGPHHRYIFVTRITPHRTSGVPSKFGGSHVSIRTRGSPGTAARGIATGAAVQGGTGDV